MEELRVFAGEVRGEAGGDAGFGGPVAFHKGRELIRERGVT